MKNYGLILDEITPDQYTFGGLAKTILMPLGNWEQYLPVYEPQFENFETAGCTVWGTQNAIETLIKRLYSEEPNYSERFTYILAGVRPPGASPHEVAECIRKDGLVDHELLPNNTDTFDEFIKPFPMSKTLIDEGEKWLNKYDFGHEWVFTNNPDKQERLSLIKEALQYSPVCVTVSAWATDPNTGLYIDNGIPNNHWVMCYGIADESLLVFDSYTQEKKRLHPDHRIQMSKRYGIYPSTRQQKLSWIEIILKWIQEQINSKKKDNMQYKPLSEVLPPIDNPIVNNSIPDKQPNVKYFWDTRNNSRHSVRVICDEEGLTAVEKNELCATIGGESNWNPGAIGKPNFDGSRDYGIIQLNNKYWIGAGKLFPDTDYVLNNPEECVRWMCKQWKLGNKNWWYAYKNGSYKRFL